MELEWVQAFIAVAESGSFSAAAEILFLSQPVVSKRVQKLERWLGAKLFDRSHRRAELTAAGRRAYPPARELARQAALLARAIHPDGTLRLALFPAADHYGFPRLLAEFAASHPEMQLIVEERENTVIPALVQSGHCDGAFFRTMDRDLPEPAIVLQQDEMALLVPEALECPAGERVPLSLFSQEQFLLLSAGTGLLEASKELCRRAGFVPRVGYIGASAGNIVRMVRNGAGLALLSRQVAHSCAGAGLRLVVPEPNCTSRLVFCPSQAGLEAPAMPALLDAVRRTAMRRASS